MQDLLFVNQLPMAPSSLASVELGTPMQGVVRGALGYLNLTL